MTTVHGLLDAAVARWPDAPAVRDASGGWTYGQLARRRDDFATWLAKRGVRPGDRVAVRAAANRHVVAMLYACAQLNAVFMPVGAAMKPYQASQLFDDAQPRVVIDDIDRLAGAEVHHAWPSTPAASDGVAATDQERGLVLLMYTSSSTMPTPKAVACRPDQVLFATRAIARRLRYQPTDVVFCRAPLSFDYGLYQVFLCALAGAELVLRGPDRDARLLNDLNAAGATVVPVVPSIATMLLRLAGRGPTTAPVRLITNTGERLPEQTLKQLRVAFPGAGIALMFGTTECKRISIMEPDGDLARPDSVGRPLDGTTVMICDADGRALPAGETGEIVVAGPHVMDGYWRAPDLTASAFRRHGDDMRRWLHTGDHGYLDSDGYLYFTGRRDQLFKRRGVRMTTLEIESAARDVAGVRDAVALAPAEHRDLALFVTGDVTADDVLRGLAQRLAREKTPSTCVVLPEIPQTANGKADRSALADRLAETGQ